MTFKLILLIIFTFLATWVLGVTKLNLDSLQTVIATSKSDTIRLEASNIYAYELRKTNLDTSIILSLSTLREANKILETELNLQKVGKLKNIIIHSYSNLFVFYRRANQFLKAIDLHAEIKNSLGQYDKTVTKANLYSNYSEIYIEIGDIQEAINYCTYAREIYQELDDKSGIASSYYNLSKIMFLQNEYKRSILFAQNALKALNETDNVIFSSYCFNLIANSYVSLGDKHSSFESKDSLFQLAGKYYNLALKIKEEYNDIGGQIITLNNLSNIEYSRKKFKLALEYIDRAYRLSKEINSKRLITNSYITYSTIYMEMGDIDKALYYSKNAYKLSEEIQNLDFKKFSSQYLSKIYKKKEDYNNALKYYEIYTILEDSTSNKEFVNKIINHEQSFKYKQKHIADSIRHGQESEFLQLELHKKEAEIKQKQTLRNWLFTLIVSLAILSFFIYRNYKNQFNARRALAAKNIQIQKQNEILEEQKTELKDINQSLNKAYQDKIDSIKFAKRIQSTTFPTDESIKEALPNSFIIYKPLDIVSGDFYWVREIDKQVVIAIGDSTGHGVPGAFMSMMGIAIIKELINSRNEFVAADILGDVRQRIIESLQHYSTDNVEEHYGMDLGIIIFNKEDKSLQYSGAFTPLYIVRNPNNIEDNSKMLEKVKADKMPISLYPKMDPYTNHQYKLNDGDMFYMFTDGTIAQYGGDNAKKLGSKLFVDKLVETSLLPIEKQKHEIERFISDWKVHINPNTGEHFLQTDDITILGVKA